MIYLDHNATTPCAPEVVQAMLPFFGTTYGNPASPHLMGREASRHVETARSRVADAVGCDATEIVFTGGATEANNAVLLGLSERQVCPRNRVLVSATEHKSVLSVSEKLKARGLVVETIPVDEAGRLKIDVLREQIRDDVLLVSVHAANNETGVIQPLDIVSAMARGKGALVHCDAAQVLGKVAFSVSELGLDFASFSGHKAYGPKGVGALYVRSGLGKALDPILVGGGQEGGLRSGTLNVPAIVGMGVACDLSRARTDEDSLRISTLRQELEKQLCKIDDTVVNASQTERLPGTSSITFEDVPADMLVTNVHPLCISTGSACTSGTVAPSHVLLAMGLSREDAQSTVRISLGRYTSEADIAAAIEIISVAVSALRSRLI
ncbi:MAG: cysteine desulfurase [Planctomycetaceae bacterium]|nr:cysteine desulfurase [Planctomycetaceae bacterium]